jgi:RNA polymerase sigma-70 factor, ECF subfamily
VQDAFVAAFQNLDRLREPQAFGSWLGSIVVRTAGKRLRFESLLQRLGLRQKEPLDVDDFAVPHLSSEALLELKELYGHLERFPVEERMVLVLKHAEGMDLLEIAEHVGVSISTVKRRLRRAEARVERFHTRGGS